MEAKSEKENEMEHIEKHGMTYGCPTHERHPDDIVGCGAVFDAEPDEEELIDCPECGCWFPHDEPGVLVECAMDAAVEDAAVEDDDDLANESDDEALSELEKEAIEAFRESKGRTWKAALGACWERSHYPGMIVDHAAALQRLRNTRGPEWLSKLRVAPAAVTKAVSAARDESERLPRPRFRP